MLKKQKNVLKSPINTQQIRLLRQFQHIREIFSVKKGLFVPKLRQKSNFSGNFDTLFKDNALFSVSLARIGAPPKAFQNKGLFASCFGMEREDAEERKAGSDKPMKNF